MWRTILSCRAEIHLGLCASTADDKSPGGTHRRRSLQTRQRDVIFSLRSRSTSVNAKQHPSAIVESTLRGSAQLYLSSADTLDRSGNPRDKRIAATIQPQARVISGPGPIFHNRIFPNGPIFTRGRNNRPQWLMGSTKTRVRFEPGKLLIRIGREPSGGPFCSFSCRVDGTGCRGAAAVSGRRV
jgi:hypothetical protein